MTEILKLPVVKKSKQTEDARGFVGLSPVPTQRICMHFLTDNGLTAGQVRGIQCQAPNGPPTLYIDQVQVPEHKQKMGYGTAMVLEAALAHPGPVVMLFPPSGLPGFEAKIKEACASSDYPKDIELRYMTKSIWMHFYATWGTP